MSTENTSRLQGTVVDFYQAVLEAEGGNNNKLITLGCLETRLKNFARAVSKITNDQVDGKSPTYAKIIDLIKDPNFANKTNFPKKMALETVYAALPTFHEMLAIALKDFQLPESIQSQLEGIPAENSPPATNGANQEGQKGAATDPAGPVGPATPATPQSDPQAGQGTTINSSSPSKGSATPAYSASVRALQPNTTDLILLNCLIIAGGANPRIDGKGEITVELDIEFNLQAKLFAFRSLRRKDYQAATEATVDSDIFFDKFCEVARAAATVEPNDKYELFTLFQNIIANYGGDVQLINSLDEKRRYFTQKFTAHYDQYPNLDRHITKINSDI